MGSATLCFSRWTQRRRRQLHRCQNRRKHRARLLTEKPLRSCRPVRPGEEKVVYGGEALPLARQIESSQLMAAQGQVAVSPLHIGTRALEHGRQPLGLVMELVLGLRAPLAQGATGLKQRGAKPLGTFPKRLAIADGSSLGHAIEIKRWDELGVHGEGGAWRQVELIDLLTNITRDDGQKFQSKAKARTRLSAESGMPWKYWALKKARSKNFISRSTILLVRCASG